MITYHYRYKGLIGLTKIIRNFKADVKKETITSTQ